MVQQASSHFRVLGFGWAGELLWMLDEMEQEVFVSVNSCAWVQEHSNFL